MIQLFWLPRGYEAFRAAIAHIAEDNPLAALAQLDAVERHIDLLLQHPEIGRLGRKSGTRELVIRHTHFVVIYAVKPQLQRIEILRVLHTSQQFLGTM